MTNMIIREETRTTLWLDFPGKRLEFDLYPTNIDIDVLHKGEIISIYLTFAEAHHIANWLLKAAEDIS